MMADRHRARGRIGVSASVLLLLAVRTVMQAQTNNAPAASTETVTNAWAFSGTVMGYLVHDERDYVQPTFTADHGWLHLEARYNYENLETGSAWVGCNFSGGSKLAWE